MLIWCFILYEFIFLLFFKLACLNPNDTNSYNRARLLKLYGADDEASWLTQTSIYLNGYKIDYLAPDCFTNLTALTELSLYKNNITCLDAVIFKDLIKLKVFSKSFHFSPSIFYQVVDSFGEWSSCWGIF